MHRCCGGDRCDQRLAVASLSSQLLRAAEVRAEIGGVGSYAPQKGQGGGEPVMFNLTIHLGDKTERIEMAPVNAEDALRGRVLEMPAFTTVGSGLALPLEHVPDQEDGELEEVYPNAAPLLSSPLHQGSLCNWSKASCRWRLTGRGRAYDDADETGRVLDQAPPAVRPCVTVRSENVSASEWHRASRNGYSRLSSASHSQKAQKFFAFAH
jgi:hypothetical protein